MPSHPDRVQRHYDTTTEDQLVSDYMTLRTGGSSGSFVTRGGVPQPYGGDRETVLRAMHEALKPHPSARLRIEQLGY